MKINSFSSSSINVYEIRWIDLQLVKASMVEMNMYIDYNHFYFSLLLVVLNITERNSSKVPIVDVSLSKYIRVCIHIDEYSVEYLADHRSIC